MFSIIVASALFMAQGLTEADKKEIAASVAESMRILEEGADRQALLERRVDLCRSALKIEDWPHYIGERVKANPSLGNKVEIIEHCMFFIHGKQEELGIAIKEDETLLQGSR